MTRWTRFDAVHHGEEARQTRAMGGGWMADRYLERLEIDWGGVPDLAGLRRLHRHHLEHVPFENLSVHLGEPVVLDFVELVAKIVVRRRGGFCYELNGGFAWLLRSLGYRVDLLEAGVFGAKGAPGPHFDHLVLRVHLDEPWLADVGFGDNNLEPLPLRTGVDHSDPGGVFRLVDAADDRGAEAVDVLRDGAPQYRLAPTAHPLSAFEPMCRFHQSSPESHFTRNIVCSRPTRRGRTTLSGRTLVVTENGSRRERELADDELLACYRDTFGIELPRPPELRMARAGGATVAAGYGVGSANEPP
jgi:N-hydroxyarylamine O-acetyltransferase